VKNIVLFELNEVPLRIIEYFVAEFPASNLGRFYGKFKRHETYTEDSGHLSPWKTWPTLHRGVTNERHMLHDFGQPLEEVDRQYPPVWKILSAHGIRTGVFGSFHSYPLPKNESYCFYVPDVFSPSPECSPDYLEPFQDLTLKMSRESGRNVSRSIPLKEVSAFLWTVPRVGIRLKTMGSIVSQLASERIHRWKSVRRRTFQTVIAFDAFLKQLELHKPQFSTFFTNHVASSMHRYWAAAFPGEYKRFGYDQDWINTYKGEILYSMNKADEMIGDLIVFADKNNYRLLIASSMGQSAIENEPLETQLWIVSPERFFERIGLQGWVRRPAMFAQFNFIVERNAVEPAERAVQSVEINGEKLTYRRDGQFFSLDFGHPNLKELHIAIGGASVLPEACGLGNISIEDKSTASAYHIPEGALLIYDASENGGEAEKISTLEIAPYILKSFELDVPGYMRTRN
jgi:hypothetical protein